MTSNPTRRLWRVFGLGAALALAGAAGAGANSILVPSGVTGGVCNANNPNSARFSQNCGSRVSITAGDPTATYVQDNSPSGETAYRARFYANLRTLQMQSGEEFEMFAAYNGADPTPPATAGSAVVRVYIQQSGTQKRLTVASRVNSGAELESPVVVLPNGWRSVELEWVKATAAGANNGRLSLWVDGAARTGLTNLDNDTLTINYARWGAVAGLDGGTFGTFRLDDFSSQRTGYIGPALAFSDNATTSPFFPFIQGIYAAEIIPACAVGSFCPNAPITRKEMAMFILLAKHGASYVPPACTTPRFSDVPCSNPFAPWINQMAAEGITGGCAAGIFCPDGNVTRSQMAVFLMVAIGASPAPCPPSAFTDVPTSSPFCSWIKEIANRGITAGCGGGSFCQDLLVSRGQMAVFLSTTFGLPTHQIGP